MKMASSFSRKYPEQKKIWPAQLVLIAIGFEGAEEPVLDAFGVKTMRNRVLAAYGSF